MKWTPRNGVGGVRHRIEQPLHQILPAGCEPVVLAAEGDDDRFLLVAGKPGEAIGVDARTDDETVELPLLHCPDADGVCADADGRHRRPESDRAAARLQVVAEGPRDRAVVGDRGRRGVQPGDAGRMGLDLPQLVPLEPSHSRHAVLGRAPLELSQAADLGLFDGHDELAAFLVGDPPFRAVRVELRNPEAAEAGLQRAGRVVDPGVHDAAVAARLVRRDVGLLFEHRHRRVRAQLGQAARDSEPDDPGADDPDSHHGRK